MANVITSDWTNINISGKFSNITSNIIQKEWNEELKINFDVDNDNYSICFDMSQNCCEDFGSNTTDDIDIKNINPDTFINLTMDYKKSGDNYDYKNEMHVNFKLSTNDNEYKIIFYNKHNGFYSHYFILKKNNISIFQTSL